MTAAPRRAGLYGRFSKEGQNPKSAGDQLVEARAYAERVGAVPVAEFRDEGISGASAVGRPGFAALVAAAKAGEFDVVIAEDLSRLARSGGDTWDLFDDLQTAGVQIETVTEGLVQEWTVGFKGTMNQVFLRDLGHKVRRGMASVVRDGRLPTCAYGYRIRREYDAKGEPIRGLREIDQDGQAPVVRRIFAEYLAGSSPQAIAGRLNAEGLPSPGGKLWSASVLVGAVDQASGILRNELYAGTLVWGRRVFRKDRRTGQVRARKAEAHQVVRQPIPDLAIVDLATWSGVQARLAETAARVKAAGNPSAANRPKRLLSGLVKCGVCGGSLATAGPGRRYACWARTQKGPTACTNARTAPADRLEAEVLAKVRADLLHPEVIEDAVREFHQLRRAKAQAAGGRRQALERELREVTQQAGRLVDLAAELGSGRTVAGKLATLEARQDALERELAAVPKAEIVTLHPNTGARFRKLVEDLAARLQAVEGTAGAEAARLSLRQVVREVRLIPGEARGQWSVEIDGDLTELFAAAPQAAARRRKA